jgi:hypothetical protein
MTPKLFDALVAYAREIHDHCGIVALENWEHDQGWCGCMGPQNGEPLCPCNMSLALAQNLTLVVNEIDGDAATRIMRRRIIAALTLGNTRVA